MSNHVSKHSYGYAVAEVGPAFPVGLATRSRAAKPKPEFQPKAAPPQFVVQSLRAGLQSWPASNLLAAQAIQAQMHDDDGHPAIILQWNDDAHCYQTAMSGQC